MQDWEEQLGLAYSRSEYWRARGLGSARWVSAKHMKIVSCVKPALWVTHNACKSSRNNRSSYSCGGLGPNFRNSHSLLPPSPTSSSSLQTPQQQQQSSGSPSPCWATGPLLPTAAKSHCNLQQIGSSCSSAHSTCEWLWKTQSISLKRADSGHTRGLGDTDNVSHDKRHLRPASEYSGCSRFTRQTLWRVPKEQLHLIFSPVFSHFSFQSASLQFHSNSNLLKQRD